MTKPANDRLFSFALTGRFGTIGHTLEEISVDFYFADNGQQRGPFPPEQLVSQGMKPDSLVWAEGMADWVPARDVPALQGLLGHRPALAPAPAPAPAPRHAPPAQGYAPPMAGYAPPTYAPPPGYQQPGYGGYATPGYMPPYQDVNGKKIAAGLCALLIGSLGIHKFVLGFPGAGITMLLITVLTCGWGGIIIGIIALIEGIIYLTKSDEQFYVDYIVNKKSWF
jgi:TM2 domain-containing membrane protein YozV